MWLWKTNSFSFSFPFFHSPFPNYSCSSLSHWLWIKCLETWMYIFVFFHLFLQTRPSLKLFFFCNNIRWSTISCPSSRCKIIKSEWKKEHCFVPSVRHCNDSGIATNEFNTELNHLSPFFSEQVLYVSSL